MGATKGLPRFAERPPGKEIAIPERARRIEHDDFKVPEERPMLEGVVEDEDISAVTLDGGPARADALGTGQDGHPRESSGDQERFVSRLPIS
jgi:hypothetical protein